MKLIINPQTFLYRENAEKAPCRKAKRVKAPLMKLLCVFHDHWFNKKCLDGFP